MSVSTNHQQEKKERIQPSTDYPLREIQNGSSWAKARADFGSCHAGDVSGKWGSGWSRGWRRQIGETIKGTCRLDRQGVVESIAKKRHLSLNNERTQMKVTSLTASRRKLTVWMLPARNGINLDSGKMRKKKRRIARHKDCQRTLKAPAVMSCPEKKLFPVESLKRVKAKVSGPARLPCKK